MPPHTRPPPLRSVSPETAATDRSRRRFCRSHSSGADPRGRACAITDRAGGCRPSERICGASGGAAPLPWAPSVARSPPRFRQGRGAAPSCHGSDRKYAHLAVGLSIGRCGKRTVDRRGAGDLPLSGRHSADRPHLPRRSPHRRKRIGNIADAGGQAAPAPPRRPKAGGGQADAVGRQDHLRDRPHSPRLDHDAGASRLCRLPFPFSPLPCTLRRSIGGEAGGDRRTDATLPFGGIRPFADPADRRRRGRIDLHPRRSLPVPKGEGGAACDLRHFSVSGRRSRFHPLLSDRRRLDRQSSDPFLRACRQSGGCAGKVAEHRRPRFPETDSSPARSRRQPCLPSAGMADRKALLPSSHPRSDGGGHGRERSGTAVPLFGGRSKAAGANGLFPARTAAYPSVGKPSGGGGGVDRPPAGRLPRGCGNAAVSCRSADHLSRRLPSHSAGQKRNDSLPHLLERHRSPDRLSR